MLRISSLSVPLYYDEAFLRAALAKRLGVPAEEILSMTLQKRSVDARDKGDVHFVLTVDAEIQNERAALEKKRPYVAQVKEVQPPPVKRSAFRLPPVVVGAGPAGLFAALTLARAGACPILMERGKPVEERTRDVERLFREGTLDPQSNVQFGEGGAGAFSDGKLTTGTKSPYQKTVLDTFLLHGAPEEIRYLQRPHVGTDKLKGVVASMRREILSLGGRVWFETTLTGLETRGPRLTGAHYQRNGAEGFLECGCLILAIGHSARDTFQRLFSQGLHMIPKPFAIGARIEHPQALINAAQYGAFQRHEALGAADYKLSARTEDGRGAYTFCMCPGGYVVAAASQPGGVVTNGMSLNARNGENANAALLVGVGPGDFGSDHPLSGLAFQRGLEQAAFRAGGGGFRAPCQRVEDFLLGRESKDAGSLVRPSYHPGVTPADLRACLPDYVIRDMRLGLTLMDRQLRGFAHPDAVLTGVETRSSSPVRIPRDEWGQGNIRGLYPAGEGAGYAGGIVSAGTDGVSAAMKAIEESLI